MKVVQLPSSPSAEEVVRLTSELTISICSRYLVVAFGSANDGPYASNVRTRPDSSSWPTNDHIVVCMVSIQEPTNDSLFES